MGIRHGEIGSWNNTIRKDRKVTEKVRGRRTAICQQGRQALMCVCDVWYSAE